MDTAKSSASSTVDFRINDKHFSVFTLTGNESLYKPFCFDVTLLINVSEWQNSWLLQPAQLLLPSREIAGIVTEESAELFDQHSLLKVQIRFEPRFALLTLQKTAQMFLQQSVVAVLTNYLQSVGYAKSQLQFHLQGSFPPKAYLFQAPGETDADFVKRIVSRVGIFFWFDTNHSREIVYIADNNIAFSNISSPELYQLRTLHEDAPDYFQISDYNENTPDNKIEAEYGNAQSLYAQQWFGLGAENNQEARALSNFYYEAEQLKRDKIIAESNNSQLMPGICFVYENQRYLITEIAHTVSEPSGPKGEGNGVVYHNHVSAVNARNPFRIRPDKHPSLPALLIGHIESNNEYAQLDSEGRYCSRLQLDLGNKPYTQAMPLLRRLSPYVSAPSDDGNAGLHWPLRDKAEVLISFLYGDPDRQVIVGSLHNAELVNPVASSNCHQHVFRTASGNEMVMDDTPGAMKILLHNPNAINSVLFDATPELNKLSLLSQGSINFIANNNITYNIGNTSEDTIAENFMQNVGKSFGNSTREGDLNYQARDSQTFDARKSTLLNSKQNVLIQSGEALLMNAGKSLQINANGQDLQFVSTNGNIHVISGKDLQIIGCGEGDILISQGNAGIEITRDGKVNLYGEQFVLTGQPVFSVQPVPPPEGAFNKAPHVVDDSKLYNQFFILKNSQTGEALINTVYRLTTASGQHFEGESDDEGRTNILNSDVAENVLLEVLEGVSANV